MTSANRNASETDYRKRMCPAKSKTRDEKEFNYNWGLCFFVCLLEMAICSGAGAVYFRKKQILEISKMFSFSVLDIRPIQKIF